MNVQSGEHEGTDISSLNLITSSTSAEYFLKWFKQVPKEYLPKEVMKLNLNGEVIVFNPLEVQIS